MSAHEGAEDTKEEAKRAREPRSARGFLAVLRALERATRPYDEEFTAAMERRWAELPEAARTPGQIIGRHGVGCEGTHGVFPKCDLKCTPCYHSRDANRVRVDGAHTREQVAAQMGLLRRLRGPRAHTQLIGGEVSLLPPDDHAAALAVMPEHGREPMSFTHGDFDYGYLERLALGPDGRRRFDRLSFAAHFDRFMYGRRGIERPDGERELDPYRRGFAGMFRRLKREHGVRFFLAHNMTVTPGNLDEIAEVIRANHAAGYGMFSFQPAAFLGDERRWKERYREATPDAVWAEIERGAGTRLDHDVFHNGDVRCNRTAYGFYVGEHWFPFLDGSDPRDLAVREAFFRHLGRVNFTGTPPALLAAKLARIAVRHPSALVTAAGWLTRAVRRAGIGRMLRHRGRVRPVTFVMHLFMDAEEVAPAWELMRRGETSGDPGLRTTQERLAACSYAMAHPENGTLVPACVQHAVLDPAENAALRRLLPIVEVRASPRTGPEGGPRTDPQPGTSMAALSDDNPKISIVMPVLDEEATVRTALRRLRRDFPGCEIVVVDGGSTDATVELAAPHAKVVRGERGRARQMNEGARHCCGEVLWFVHADTRIDPAALGQIHAALRDPDVVGGGLTLRFDRRGPGLGCLARTSNARARRLHHVFGDQAMFVRRTAFDTLGGFPDLAIMEDLEMSRRLARLGELRVLSATSTASARRLVAHGVWRMIVFMQYLKLLYFAGVDPETIRRRYAAGPRLLPRLRRNRPS
ncbi:TIGR04283 family arsenosugar biosynthesis glycosyltransferase [Streptomyces sp. KLOTTS4A1]|uniref:TIGR04283 family arsenosugar biosynthesis glycosyltransferase n=1 Tax=Streptomyces sp. KLOTTS4A1 TaxID=3390996 RepID=UPI0039F4795C